MKFQRHFATSGNLNDICEKIRAAAKFGLGAEQTRINLVDLESQKIGFDAAENKPSKIRAVATPPFPASKTNTVPGLSLRRVQRQRLRHRFLARRHGPRRRLVLLPQVGLVVSSIWVLG